MKNMLIEGWRGVNHSFALVNQCQILEMLRLPDLQLFHRDLPFAMAHWNNLTHSPGFAPADWAKISGLQAPNVEPVDCIYRICSPFRNGLDGIACRARQGTEAPPTLSFMVTEMGLTASSFDAGVEHSDVFTRDANLIVTPTQWSRERLLEWGYAPEKVRVIAHGVNSQTFCPLLPVEREANRRNLGFESDQFVFLNLGAAMWNKGLDVLLMAYALLRQSNKQVRLVLKDQRNLYGIGMDSVLKTLCQHHPTLFTADTLASISMVTVNLSQAQLASLYSIADCYVSPYRAEGFNLPVLEAIACGTPVVVTGEGATADFCHPGVALMVDSSLQAMNSPQDAKRVLRYREPKLDSLVETMSRMAGGAGLQRDAAFESAARDLVSQLGWDRPARDLLALAGACVLSVPPAADAAQAPGVVAELTPRQAEPCAM